MTEQRDYDLGVLADQSKQLELSGGLYNLLGFHLQLLNGCGGHRTSYPREKGEKAQVHWRDIEHRLEIPRDYRVEMVSEVDVIGSLNEGHIDLVRPTMDLTDLVQRWKDASASKWGKLQGLPDMKAWRKEHARVGMEMYCLVSPEVALTAYFNYEELGYLMVPAQPFLSSGSVMGYCSLMPAGYLIANTSIRR